MPNTLEKIYVDIKVDATHKRRESITLLYGLVSSLVNLLRAAYKNGPGVKFHAAIALSALRWIGSRLSKGEVYRLLTSPMDTFRYFEFDFFWKSISQRNAIDDYLDVSSPRMFCWRVIASGKTHRAVILNPDAKDLSASINLFEAIGIDKKCEFCGDLIGEFEGSPNSFDLVTCISVLEHIPDEASINALQAIWKLVKPGGQLLLSVPCAATAFEEFISFNEYGLLQTQSDGYVFGQRFYDQRLVENHIFDVVGQPARMAVFGEKMEGTFVRDRERKLSDADYPFWREPWIMASEYQYFDRIESMPGLGVVAFEFVKR